MAKKTNPKRPEIAKEVIAAIQRMLKAAGSNKVVNEDEKQNLKRDLGMSLPLKKAMGTLYSDVSEAFENGRTVSLEDSGKCKLVKDAVDLTFKRAQGK